MIYVDEPIWKRGKRGYSHLISDTSFDELHLFAATIGMMRRSFHRDHYDLPSDMYELALEAGAKPAGPRDIARLLREAGLRRRPKPRSTK